MTSIQKYVALNASIARAIWGQLTKPELIALKELLRRFRFSIAQGDLQYLAKGWYITHAGLLRLAQRRRCAGIRVQSVHEFCKPEVCQWVFKATVYKSARSNAYMGYGDANPSNVSPLVRGAEMRVAETRAVNRALRKAYGIGLCSVEELGWEPKSDSQPREATATNHGNGNGANGSHHQPRLRDRLCLL